MLAFIIINHFTFLYKKGSSMNGVINSSRNRRSRIKHTLISKPVQIYMYIIKSIPYYNATE